MTDGPIPLFPLDTVLVPGLVMPLHIFEPRYRQLIADLQLRPEEDRTFLVACVKDARMAALLGAGETDRDWRDAIYDVGTVASVREIEPLEDECFDIVTVGTDRLRIRAIDHTEPYLQAYVDEVPEAAGDNADALALRVIEDFVAYRSMFADDDTELPDEPRVLSYLIAAAVVGDVHERQSFLAAPDDTDRLRREHAFLRRENSIIDALPSLPAVELTRDPYSLN